MKLPWAKLQDCNSYWGDTDEDGKPGRFVPEDQAVAFMKLCKLGTHPNFDATEFGKYAKRLWSEIFESKEAL